MVVASKISDVGLSVHLTTQAEVFANLLGTLAGGVHRSSIHQPSNVVELGLHKLEPGVIAGAKALAFFEVSKGGIVVTYGTGDGFIIKKNPNTRTGWGAPVLMKLRQWGVGTAVGLADQQCLLVINDESLIEDVINSMEYKLSADLFLPAGNELTPDMPGCKVYTLTHGTLLLDLSVNGSCVEVDRQAMEKAYGVKGKEPEELLAGMVQPPLEELSKLYAKLQAMCGQ